MAIAKKVKGKAIAKKAPMKPLGSFNGYNIHRSKSTVEFGCGALKLKKSEILALAEAYENPEFMKHMKRLMQISNAAYAYIGLRDILKIKPLTLRRIAG